MIQVYDTEQRKKVPFETREPGKVAGPNKAVGAAVKIRRAASLA